MDAEVELLQEHKWLDLKVKITRTCSIGGVVTVRVGYGLKGGRAEATLTNIRWWGSHPVSAWWP